MASQLIVSSSHLLRDAGTDRTSKPLSVPVSRSQIPKRGLISCSPDFRQNGIASHLVLYIRLPVSAARKSATLSQTRCCWSTCTIGASLVTSILWSLMLKIVIILCVSSFFPNAAIIPYNIASCTSTWCTSMYTYASLSLSLSLSLSTHVNMCIHTYI